MRVLWIAPCSGSLRIPQEKQVSNEQVTFRVTENILIAKIFQSKESSLYFARLSRSRKTSNNLKYCHCENSIHLTFH